MDDMDREEEPRQLHPEMVPAEADPATAALTATPPPEEAGEPTPEEEQEDPQAERKLPGEGEGSQEEGETPLAWAEEEDEEPPAEAAPVAAPTPVPTPAMAAPVALPGPAPAVRDAARQQYWRQVLTGSAETVPDSVRERAGRADAGVGEEQGEYRLLSTINRSWAVDHLGMEKEQVRAGWARLRGQLARRYQVADDERELFAALSVEAQDAPRREQVEAHYEAHFRAALLGGKVPPSALGEGLQIPCARELEQEARRRGESLRRRYLPLAREVAEGLNVFAGMEEELIAAPRVLASVPGLARSIESLAQMDEPARRMVYTMAQAEYLAGHPQGDASLYRTVRRATARGATGLGIGAGQALTHASVASMNALGNLLGEEWGKSLRENAGALDLRSRILDEIRHLHHEEVKPLNVSAEAGFAGQLLVDAAAGTPMALAACCGGAGFATLSLSGMGEAVAAARRRAPEGSHWLQYLAGVLGGGIQASIYAGMSRVGGQMLGNAISHFARASGRGVGGYTLASLSTLGAMGFESAKLLFASKAAEVAGLGTQEIAARLERTASNIDWKEYGDNAQDLELNLREAAMLLPFILISSGRVALRHFRSRHAVLGDGHALQQWGMDEATRDAIMKEVDINRQGDMLRDALRGSRRWSAPGFIPEAMRALRLLNTDYFSAFKDRQAVVDFLKLPSQGSQVPRPPFVQYSVENPEHVRQLQESHGSGEKVNRQRLPLALQLYDEWVQKAHIVPESAAAAEGQEGGQLPTSARRRRYGLELLELDSLVPPRMRLGGFYAPHAEVERMAMLRDRVAEIHDLSYQVLLSAFPLDALSHSTRSLNHLRADGEKVRRSLLEAVGRCVLRRATGVPETEAMDELGKAVSGYFARRRYSDFPPGWMGRVPSPCTLRLDEHARATFRFELSRFPVELRDAYRVALGLRSCAAALYELLPIVPDFQTSLARGLSPVESYVHLLSRELGVDMAQARGVEEMLAPYGRRATDMRAYRLQNEAAYEAYRLFTGCEMERVRVEGKDKELWRVRRPNGSYTNWHRLRRDAINDLVANTSFTFMPFSYDRAAPLRVLDPARGYDLNTEGREDPGAFTGYEQLCRIALRDTARSWVESAPYAQPGFEMADLRRYIYLGGKRPLEGLLVREGGEEKPDRVQVDTLSLTSPLRLAQARFRTYWWRELNSGLLSAGEAGEELVKLRVITPEELARVRDIAKPLLKPRGRNVPLKDTPPPDVPGMNRALAEHLTDFSMRYFLAHLDDMPLPASAREWFRLAPLCPLEQVPLPARSTRLSIRDDSELYTSLHNREAVRELRESIPAVSDLRRAEREGLLQGSRLLMGVRDAIGLNRARNLEQGWCAELSEGAAMMGASQPYWRMLERPLDNWGALDAAEQDLLRNHAEGICRTELSPEAMEAEGRGENPDYFMLGLRNLQEVLEDYPALHQYGLTMRKGEPFIQRLVPEEPGQGGDPFAEPEYEHAPLYTGGSLRAGYRLSAAEPLQDYMLEDARVLPAMHLLGFMRSFPGNRSYTSPEGIRWQGKLYGGLFGEAPASLEHGWLAELPLANLISFLRKMDKLSAAGCKMEAYGLEIPGLGEEVNLRPLSNVTLYRSMDNPSNLCRLMPGEPEAANVAARTPYLVQSIAGGTLDGMDFLRDAEDMHRAYIPLESFRRPYFPRVALLETQKMYREASVDYTLSGVLSSTMRMASLSNPKGGLVGMRELLLRFAEDTGFSLSLPTEEPDGISYGQLLGLKLSREMLLCICGENPEAAYRRLVRLGHRIRRNSVARTALRRALSGAVDGLYDQGRALFRKSRSSKKKAADKQENEETPPSNFKRREIPAQTPAPPPDDAPFGGTNDSVRSDGYSKGYFDD